MKLSDARMTRFDQAVLSLVLLCGFVFEAPWVIPVGAGLAVLSAVGPRVSPGQRLFASAIAPRLLGPPVEEDGRAWRAAALLSAVLLVLASLLLLAGWEAAAWTCALPAAALGALAAFGGFCLGCWWYARRLERRRS